MAAECCVYIVKNVQWMSHEQSTISVFFYLLIGGAILTIISNFFLLIGGATWCQWWYCWFSNSNYPNRRERWDIDFSYRWCLIVKKKKTHLFSKDFFFYAPLLRDPRACNTRLVSLTIFCWRGGGIVNWIKE